MTPAEARAKVLERWPGAVGYPVETCAQCGTIGYRVAMPCPIGPTGTIQHLGDGPTEDAAWLDAAQRLEEK